VRRGLGAVALTAAALASLAACSSFGYAVRSLGGGAGILLRRHSITRLLARPDLPADSRRNLETALAIREFAIRELALPDSRSYRSYVELGREYATWNVVAAPSLSLEPRRWCFPVAGCVSYRGYFHRRGAERFAERLAADGLDVTIRGATAYSTLGWFADPVLDTFFTGADWQVAALLFHELAHQVAYAADDTAFNESFATSVEQLGLDRWLAARGDPREAGAVVTARREERELTALLLAARAELAALYAAELPAAEKLNRKQETLQRLAAEIGRRLDAGELSARLESWRVRQLNNADLAAIADYEIWVPALRALFTESGGFPAFYVAARELATAPGDERQRRLAALRDRAAALPAP